MVILRTRNKITDFLMILAWASPFKSEDLSSDFTFYPLVTGPVHSCVISTPRGSYSPAAVSAQWTYRTHCHLCPTRYSFSPESSEAFEGEVSCPRTHHLNNVPRLIGEKHDISLKILHQAGFKTERQAATSAERHALNIAPCPSHDSLWAHNAIARMRNMVNVHRSGVRHNVYIKVQWSTTTQLR